MEFHLQKIWFTWESKANFQLNLRAILRAVLIRELFPAAIRKALLSSYKCLRCDILYSFKSMCSLHVCVIIFHMKSIPVPKDTIWKTKQANRQKTTPKPYTSSLITNSLTSNIPTFIFHAPFKKETTIKYAFLQSRGINSSYI